MNRLRVVVARDQSSAEVHAVAGPPAGAAELRTALAAAGVVHGIDEPAAQAFAAKLQDATFHGSEVLARGATSQKGRDGRVEFAFPQGLQPGHLSGNSVLDYHERDFLHPAANGDVIAHVVPPTPGVPGKNVLGKPLPVAPVRAIALRGGPGVTIEADGSVRALRDGVVTATAATIDVVPLFVHKGNVDLHTGNLHTKGSVQVGGDVNADFCVEAEGDVDVKGGTFGAAITAGGSIRIGLGAQDRSRIDAGGDVLLRHATASTIWAAGNVEALDELARCETAASAIRLEKGRGHLLGGSARALTSIVVLRAGSPAAVPTLLAAADLAIESHRLTAANAQLDRAERSAMKAQSRLDGPARGGRFGRQATAAQDAALRERVLLAQRQKELLPSASIEIRGEAHAGVRIRIGTQERVLDTALRSVRFRWDPETGTILQESS